MTQKNILKKKINVSWLEPVILIFEIMLLFGLMIIIFNQLKWSWEYFLIGGASLIVIFWRVKYRK